MLYEDDLLHHLRRTSRDPDSWCWFAYFVPSFVDSTSVNVDVNRGGSVQLCAMIILHVGDKNPPFM